MYILIDIGGTNTRIAGTKDKETFGEPIIFSTPQNFEEWLVKASEVIMKLQDESILEAIIIGMAGTFLEDHSTVHISPHLPLWNNMNIGKILGEKFSCKIILENDTALVGLGEAVYGGGKGYDIVAYITISTGVGGVRIIDGHIDRNSIGFEIGHEIVNDGKEIEYYLAGSSHQVRFGKPSSLIKDPLFWKEVDYYTGILTANTIMFWSPAVIVLGGPVVNDIDLERAYETTKEFTKVYEHIPSIVRGTLGSLGGLYGGLALTKTLEK